MVPKTGKPETIFGPGPALAITADETGVYWLLYDRGKIIKVEKSSMAMFFNIFAPRPGDSWAIRSQQVIQWWFGGITGKVSISLSRDGGKSWTTLFRNIANKGSQRWKVTKPATTQAIIRVCSVSSPSICDTSDVFTIQ